MDDAAAGSPPHARRSRLDDVSPPSASLRLPHATLHLLPPPFGVLSLGRRRRAPIPFAPLPFAPEKQSRSVFPLFFLSVRTETLSSPFSPVKLFPGDSP